MTCRNEKLDINSVSRRRGGSAVLFRSISVQVPVQVPGDYARQAGVSEHGGLLLPLQLPNIGLQSRHREPAPAARPHNGPQ